MSAHFNEKSLDFLLALARNNNRDWFQTHKTDYETYIREPFQHLLMNLQPALRNISEHYHADPSKVGGSLYRIHRDTRFSGDKSPYKPWQGAHLFHSRRKQIPAPGFYIHLQPSQSFVAAGLWHPAADILRRIRQFIVDNPNAWHRAAHAPAFRKCYALESADNLIRAPRGFPADYPYLEDLKRRHFVAMRALDDKTMISASLAKTLEKDLKSLSPFVDYLCAALDLPF